MTVAFVVQDGKARVPVRFSGIVPSLFVERRARGLLALRPFDGTWETEAVAALNRLVDDGRFARLVLERVDPELDAVLKDAGYTPTPKGWTRYG